jgi:3-hydroxyisobutyrate dehydrogenase-like beta-hydroxyacid dehydrogenase
MSDQSKPLVGFIGLGIMGAAMASNLQAARYRLLVNDVRRSATDAHLDAGAKGADTPQEVARNADVVFTCLPDNAAIEAVALGPEGILSGIRPGQAFFDLSTSAPDLVKRLFVAFERKGAHMLDAPVSGGAIGARRARLAIWVGGDKASYDRYEPVLRVMGDQPVHVGKIGTGIVTKLVNNCMAQATQAAIAEVFMLGVKAGAEPLALWEALRQGAAGRRRTLDGLIDEFLPAQYDPPHSALRIVHKDMVSATDLARSLNVPLRYAALTLADIQEAMQRGWAERDSRSVMLLPQERVGVTVKEEATAIDAVLQRDPAAPSDSKRGTSR